jgi:hypothetical protein
MREGPCTEIKSGLFLEMLSVAADFAGEHRDSLEQAAK